MVALVGDKISPDCHTQFYRTSYTNKLYLYLQAVCILRNSLANNITNDVNDVAS